MVTSTALYLALLAALTLERWLELARSRRNARVALADGAQEFGRAHFPWMVAFHATFLPACAAEVLLAHRPFPGAWGWLALGVVALAQGLRWWTIATLGPRWSVRVIVPAEAAPVVGGPYRFLRHPNYLAVILEVAFIPLVHGAWMTALAASLINAALLTVRIPCEEAALGPRYARVLGGMPRLVPRGPR